MGLMDHGWIANALTNLADVSMIHPYKGCTTYVASCLSYQDSTSTQTKLNGVEARERVREHHLRQSTRV